MAVVIRRCQVDAVTNASSGHEITVMDAFRQIPFVTGFTKTIHPFLIKTLLKLFLISRRVNEYLGSEL